MKAYSRAAKLDVKRKRGRRTKTNDPGRAILPEDRQYQNFTLHFERGERKQVAPQIKGSEKISRSEAKDRILTAMKTIRALPDKERRFFVVKSSGPEYVQEYIDAYASVEAIAPKFRPTPFDVSDCLNALSWLRHLKKSSWQIVWWRSFDISYGQIAEYIGRSDETARKRFEEAITDAWAAANGIGV